MLMVYPAKDGYFRQDNAPCYKAVSVRRWLEEHQRVFTLLNWPAQSQDLNPVENSAG